MHSYEAREGEQNWTHVTYWPTGETFFQIAHTATEHLCGHPSRLAMLRTVEGWGSLFCSHTQVKELIKRPTGPIPLV